MGARLKALGLVLFVVGVGAPARARADLGEVGRLVSAGDLAGAEAACDRVLAAEPSRLDARLERAHVRSYRHEFDGARADFEAVLASRPGDVAALTGLGYSLAWAGAYDDAERRFSQALDLDPESRDAAKGRAYVALWRGDEVEAARRFTTLSARAEGDGEAAVGLGRALLAAGRPGEARAAFERALAIEPGRADAREALLAFRPFRPRVDVTVLGGVSALGGDRESGVRFAELGLSPADGARVWAQYDDTLSLDGAIARSGERAPALLAGGLLRYGDRHTSRLEAGWRTLPGGVGEALVRGEQVLDLARGAALRLGAFGGFRDGGPTEATFHLGATMPARRDFRLEPTLFYGRSGRPGEHDVRALLAGTYRLSGRAEIGGGVASGWTFAAAGRDGAPLGLFLRGTAALGARARGHLLLQRERPAAGPALTVAAVGLTVTAGGRP